MGKIRQKQYVLISLSLIKGMNYPRYQPAMDQRMKMQMQFYYDNMYNFGPPIVKPQANCQERVQDKERKDDGSMANGVMKSQPKEIQIQTDLTLLNIEIEVFPKKDAKIMQSFIKNEKKIKKDKKVMNSAKKPKRTEAREISSQPSQQHKEKEANDYVITVNLQELAGQMQPQEVLQLRRNQSQFQNYQREIQENLRDIVKDTEIDYFKECLCKGYAEDSHSFQCRQCKHKYHYKCLGLDKDRRAEPCHVCKLVQFDPANEVKEIIGTYYIQDISNKKFQINLSLTQYQYFIFKKIRAHEIQLRCLMVGDDSQYSQQTWPDEVFVLINDKKICEIQALSLTSPLKKRRDGSISISNFIFQEPQPDDQLSNVKITIVGKKRSNDLKVKHINNDSVFYLGIYFIQKVAIEQLYSKYEKTLKNYSNNFIASLMGIGDCDIQLEKVVCTLKDPYTGLLMQNPVRGAKCQHGQCFDLKTYLHFMYVTNTWKCPICRKEAKEFLLDQQILQLVKKSIRERISVKEVSFMKDGRTFLKIGNEQSDQEQDNLKSAKKKKPIEKMTKEEPKESKYASH